MYNFDNPFYCFNVFSTSFSYFLKHNPYQYIGIIFLYFFAPPLYIQLHIDFLDTMFFVHTILSVVVTPYNICLITLQGLVIVVLSIWHHYCCVCVFVFNHITILIGFIHIFSFIIMFQTSFLL